MKKILAALLSLIVSVCLAQSTGINGGGPNGGGGGGSVSITAGAGITVSPSPLTGTGTVSLTSPVTVPLGGSGQVTLAAHGLLVGEGTSAINSVAPMALDTLLQGQGVTVDPLAVTILNCGSSTQALSYSTSTHIFGCQTITGSPTPPGGVTTEVQFNLAGAFAGDVGFEYGGGSSQTLSLGTTLIGATIQAAASSSQGRPFSILGSPGASGGDGGPTSITAGSGGAGATTGGAISLTAGSGGSTGGGGLATVKGGSTASSTSGGAVLQAGTVSSSGIGGTVALTGANGGVTGTGSPVTVTAGNGGSTSGNAGSVTIAAGTVVSGTAGSVLVKTAGLTRLTIDPSGAFTFGDGTTAVNLNGAGKLGFNLNGGSTTGSPGLADNVVLTGGTNTSFATTGGVITAQGAQTLSGGAVNLTGGTSPSGVGGTGGAINITAGTSVTSTAGSVNISTGTGSTSNGTIHLQIAGSDAVLIGTAGQETLSNAFISAGTKFTATGCTNSATVGGAIAGQFTSGTTGTCTVVITLPTAPNGWACHADDLTTPANFIGQSAKTTTSCTVQGTTVTNDIIVFSAMAY